MSEFDESEEMSREELVSFISQFMANNMSVEQVYRSHLCESLVHRVRDEFGPEGLCDLMVKIDSAAGWISDILLDAPDLENAMFAKYGVFDQHIVEKARATTALLELNRKIYRLRKKYTKLIVDEIFATGDGAGEQTSPKE
jgi:hypothetical protein